LQNQIQTASIQSHLTPLGAIQLSPHLIPVDGLRRSLQRALKHCQPEDFLYCNKQGHQLLRQALSDHWREDGIYVATEDIFISNGCMPAIALLIQQMSREGDSIIIPTPTFNGQLQMLASLKRKIIEIPADHLGIDLERLEFFMQQGSAKLCLLTANYQNPLGYCLNNQQKQKIASWLSSINVLSSKMIFMPNVVLKKSDHYRFVIGINKVMCLVWRYQNHYRQPIVSVGFVSVSNSIFTTKINGK
jgi:DNA-binding transcriptional MocR family regulator